MITPEITRNDFEFSAPPRRSRIETYLWDIATPASVEFATHIFKPEKPIAPYGVLIPVAAHQEADRILHSMSQYALQDGDTPFSIVLSLNYPRGANQQNVQHTIDAVTSAQAAFPQLDLRFYIAEYTEPTIGAIRKDLWDSTMRVALKDGLYDSTDGEFIGINHDIDTETIGRHYIQNIQKYYTKYKLINKLHGEPDSILPPRFTQVKHQYPFDTHPNIARAIFWEDFSSRQISNGGCYEEGLVLPMTHYAQRFGFDEDSSTYETSTLGPEYPIGIDRTPMETSPRRYIARLGEVITGNIWSDETFGSDDSCREPSRKFRDITTGELETRVLDSLEDYMFGFAKRGIGNSWIVMTHDLLLQAFRDRTNDKTLQETYEIQKTHLEHRLRELLAPRIRLARYILEKVIKSPDLANLVDESLVDSIIEQYMQAILREASRLDYNEYLPYQ